jgi:diphthine synthase
VLVADRELVEQDAERLLLEPARSEDVALLVVGDPFGATTHTDLVTRCVERGIPFSVVHNASIMNAVGACGLQLYNFGRTVSICFFTETWRPDSFYDMVRRNKAAGLHTLCLLDIKVKEQSIENMARGRRVYEPPRYMTVNQCIAQLLEVEAKHGGGVCGPDAMAAGIARVGSPDQRIVAGPLRELLTVDFGAPLHSLVLAGETDVIENEMLRLYAVSDATPRLAAAPAEDDGENEAQ